MRIYFDFNDWWIGYYRGSNYHFICPLPTLVIRWPNQSFKVAMRAVATAIHEADRAE